MSKADQISYSAKSQKSGLPLGGEWRDKGVLFAKGHKTREPPRVLKIFCILIWMLFTQLYLYVKIHPPIYLRFVYCAVCYASIKLLVKRLMYMCVLENSEGCFPSSLMDPTK